MILVTGANGLIGSEVCRLLISESIPFRALKRSGSDLSLCDDLEMEWLEGDVTDLMSIDKSIVGIDTVIHCAAMVSFDEQDKDQMMNVNVKGTENFINCCLVGDVRNFIHISSIAALGRSKEKTEINETSQWIHSSHNTNYAESKHLSELEVWRGQCEGLNVAIVNPSVVIAAADGTRSSSKLLQYIWEEHKFYINRNISFVDVRDVAKAILQIHLESRWGQRYILSNGNLKYQELFTIIANHLDKNPPKWNVHMRFMKLGVLLSRALSWITRRPALVSNELVKSMQDDFTYSNRKIVDEMGFQFQKHHETLEWACAKFYKFKQLK